MTQRKVHPAELTWLCPVVGCLFPGAPNNTGRGRHLTELHDLGPDRRKELGIDNTVFDMPPIPWEQAPITEERWERSIKQWVQPRYYFTQEEIDAPITCHLCGKGWGGLVQLTAHWVRTHSLDYVDRIGLLRDLSPHRGAVTEAHVLDEWFDCPVPSCSFEAEARSGLGIHMAKAHDDIPQPLRKDMVREAVVSRKAADTETQPELWSPTTVGTAITMQEAAASTALDGETHVIDGPVAVGDPIATPNGVEHGGRPKITVAVLKLMFPNGVPVELIDDAYSFSNHAEHVARISGQN